MRSMLYKHKGGQVEEREGEEGKVSLNVLEIEHHQRKKENTKERPNPSPVSQTAKWWSDTMTRKLVYPSR